MRVDASLVALMAASALAAVAWTCVLPPLEGPDEDSHVAYVQKIAETGTIPWARGETPEDLLAPYSTELAYALTFGAVTSTARNPAARPARTAADERIWSERDARLTDGQRADGRFTTAMKNPPLYYVYAALPYKVASGGSIFDRVFAMRLANIVALLVVVAFAWLIAGELLGGRRWLQALATAAVALQPQLVHMTAVVNPDVMLAAIWTAALYVMTVMLKRGASRAGFAALAALTIASALTQPRGLALVAPAALTVAVLALRRWPRARVIIVSAIAAAGLACAYVLVAYALRGDVSASSVRQFGSYVWQFYLPDPGFLQDSISDFGIGHVFDRYFGGFANLDATFTAGVFRSLKIASLAVALLALVGVIARRRELLRRPAVALVYAAAVVGYLALLHAVAYRSLLVSADPVITGRYMLPLVVIYGLAIALAVSWLPRRWGVAAGGVALAAVVLLQLAALAVTFERFYA
jgi:4-amino-4-deoxy-L-arabinose transferase-like glycosyltransferase